MKWSRSVAERLAKNGDWRTRRQFAWWPIDVGDHVVWLESYEIEERYFETPGCRGRWSEMSRRTVVKIAAAKN